jgi:hypothetical protein
MQREITFENLPQAVSELIQKVDSLIQTIDMQNGIPSFKGEYEEPMIGIEDACNRNYWRSPFPVILVIH